MSNDGFAKVLAAGVAPSAWTAAAVADTPSRHIRGTIASVQEHMAAVTTARGATDDITPAAPSAAMRTSRAAAVTV